MLHFRCAQQPQRAQAPQLLLALEAIPLAHESLQLDSAGPLIAAEVGPARWMLPSAAV